MPPLNYWLRSQSACVMIGIKKLIRDCCMQAEEVRKLCESDLRETRQLKIRNRKKASHQIPEVGTVVNADF